MANIADILGRHEDRDIDARRARLEVVVEELREDLGSQKIEFRKATVESSQLREDLRSQNIELREAMAVSSQLRADMNILMADLRQRNDDKNIMLYGDWVKFFHKVFARRLCLNWSELLKETENEAKYVRDPWSAPNTYHSSVLAELKKESISINEWNLGVTLSATRDMMVHSSYLENLRGSKLKTAIDEDLGNLAGVAVFTDDDKAMLRTVLNFIKNTSLTMEIVTLNPFSSGHSDLSASDLSLMSGNDGKDEPAMA